MVRRILLMLIFLFSLVLSSSDINSQIEYLLSAEDESTREIIIEDIVEQNYSCDSVIRAFRQISYGEPVKKGIVKLENRCLDGVKRPYFLYIPEGYESSKENPLMVILHGGVSRPKLMEEPEQYVRGFTRLAIDRGFILLFPMGQYGATWWDSVGIANIMDQIRTTRSMLNINDNRVYMSGFSDGGSGSFLFAMKYPTSFAGFMSMNGHPGVGAIDGGLHTYFPNLSNRPLHVINTDEDELYPAEKMKSMYELALKAGADLIYRIYTGIGHSYEYAAEEYPEIVDFLQTHSRNLTPRIVWETAVPGERCDWLSVESISGTSRADWHNDYNMKLIDDRVSFGFYPDDTHKGDGVKIGKLVGDTTLCTSAGLSENDIIIKADGMAIGDIEDLSKYKGGKERGDSAVITVLRNGKENILRGKFPEPGHYKLFRREKPSGKVIAEYCGNTFYLQTSQVDSIGIFINPSMVQLDQEVEIFLNGKQIFKDKIEPSVEFVLRDFLKRRDRKRIYVEKISTGF